MNQKILWCFVLTVILSTSLFLGLNGCSSAAPVSKTEETDVVVTSSLNENHSHNITIDWIDIFDANRSVTYTTLENGTPTHTHTVLITIQNFKDIKQGKTVTVTSSPPTPGFAVVSNHIHQFAIKK